VAVICLSFYVLFSTLFYLCAVRSYDRRFQINTYCTYILYVMRYGNLAFSLIRIKKAFKIKTASSHHTVIVMRDLPIVPVKSSEPLCLVLYICVSVTSAW